MERYIIEGEWSGYQPGQQRISHRSVHKAAFKRLREWVEKTRAITYADGTVLRLTVRDCTPRERVKENRSYMSLIENCCLADVSSVEALRTRKERIRL